MSLQKHTLRKTLQIELSAEDVARAFCEMDSDEMTAFFNIVAIGITTWTGPFCMQMQYITDNEQLTAEARSIMRQIGDYSERMT